MENVKVLKLTTGDEIVSELTDEGSFFRLKNPVRFIISPVSDSQMGVQMHPYVILSDDKEFDILKDFVITVCNPVDEVLQSYQSQFSDLVLPPENKLVT